MIETQGYGVAQHTGREFRLGGVVQVTELGAARLGQRGVIEKIWTGGTYNIVVRHADGVSLPYSPDELAVVAGAVWG